MNLGAIAPTDLYLTVTDRGEREMVENDYPTLFKPRLNIQRYNFCLAEWSHYNLDWLNPQTGIRLVVPPYQRGFVWEEERYIAFIESIFDRISLQEIYIDSRHVIYPPNEEMIIDGKHRLKALIRFFNDDLRVRGHLYSELEVRDQRQFDMDVIIPVCEMKHCSERDVVNVYLQVNFEKIPHTGQDMEKALAYLEGLK